MDNDKLKEMWAELKTQRDELRVQLHLANAELKDEWVEVEKKLETAQDHFEQLVEGAGETAHDVQGLVAIVGEEISEAYARIRKRVKSDSE